MLHTTAANRLICWCLVAVAVAGNAAGYWMNLYERLGWFDEVIHFYTMFSLSLLVGLALYDPMLTGRRRHPILLTVAMPRTVRPAWVPSMCFGDSGGSSANVRSSPTSRPSGAVVRMASVSPSNT